MKKGSGILIQLLRFLGLRKRKDYCLALYGKVDGHKDYVHWYEWLTLWFESLGIEPDLMAVHEKGKESTEKLVSVEQGKRKLRKSVNLLSGVTLGATTFLRLGGNSGFRVQGTFAEVDNNYAYLLISFDSELVSLELDGVKRLIVDQLNFFSASYGYVFTRDVKKGIFTYALGATNDAISKAECKQIVSWFNILGRKDTQVRTPWHRSLRDVYEYNLLNSEQTGLKIGSETLLTWIQNNSVGCLEKIEGKELWVWTLSKAEQEFARGILKKENVLIADWDLRKEILDLKT